MRNWFRKVSEHPTVKQLGPGLITGAADDDPSGIATYSQAGAQFGNDMLWTVVFTYPLMVGIQMVSARLGYVTGRGLAANIRSVFPRWLLYGIVGLLLFANTLNIAADVAAMGQALQLLLGGSHHAYSLMFGLLCLTLQVFLPYQRYVRYLRWLTLALLSYVAVVFFIDVPWFDVLKDALLPETAFTSAGIVMIVAVFGTTISPYLFFWQAAQEVEDLRGRKGASASDDVPAHLRRIKTDTWFGMGFSSLIAFFIILTTAATLHAHGVQHIETSAQAAEALRPIAGDFTFLMFALGIIGTGMLAVPVLAGSAAYAVTESFEWRNGLDLKLLEAREFYGIIAFATLGGVVLGFTSIDPIQALIASALVNGVIAVPIMVVMMLLASRPDVLGKYVITRRHRVGGWAATAMMAAAVVAMFATL
ncbi:MAG TPA: divalent metal cation transporter [Nevskiaceae bacterium]|nr:divalent metal cation transporter [Nevskiaceae bacterium]